MGLYGIRDSANLVFKNLRTKQIALYVDYANVTTSEWSAESVYATKKGANQIRWDNDKNGTLTVETEMFDFGYLAMAMGSDIVEGRDSILKRAEAVLDETKKVKIGEASAIDAKTISVIKLRAAGDTEHSGEPLFNASSASGNLPGQVRNVSIAANDKTARITFPRVNGADKYLIIRDNQKVAEVNTTSYTDTKLTAETQYTYEIQAVNEFGKGAKSAKVKPTTSVDGTQAFTTFEATSQDKNAAASNQGEVVTPDNGEVSYTYNDGIITFNEHAVVGDAYAIYFMNEVENVRKLTIEADKFPDSYEIFGTTKIRSANDGVDEMVEVHYFNVKPQSNFTLTQSATEPTTLSITFDIFPRVIDGKKVMMEYKAIQ